MHVACRLGAVLAVGCLAFGASTAPAAEYWSVQNGRTTVHFNTELMDDLGLSLTDVRQTATINDNPHMEGPQWHFRLAETSDLTFKVDEGIFAASAPLEGSLYFEGGFGVRDNNSGQSVAVSNFEVAPATQQTGIGPRTVFELRNEGEAPAFDLVYGGIRYLRDEDVLHVYGFDVKISEVSAQQLGRPELSGRMIGMGEIHSDITMSGGVAFTGEIPGPNSRGGCTVRDVKLGILDNISYVNGGGGVAALSMATTSCNVGNCDVEWEAPMDEDHPGIAMSLYRLMNDRFEQVGVSYIKHGFFALSSSQCTPCQNPSNGDYLGVGCSDTYGVGNNSDRRWLGPRSEWSSFPGTWECTGSHFSDGVQDCNRRHSSGGHSNTAHRVEVLDSDIDNPGASYFFSSYYIVRDDDNKINNMGYRPCTVSGGPNNWNFNDGSGYPVIEGPAVAQWGDFQTWATLPGDGQVYLASKATDMGGGVTHFEYALLNYDADKKIKSFEVPLSGATGLANIGYHDPDLDAGNDWGANTSGGSITWSTTDHPIGFGEMFNFRFDAMTESEAGDITVESFTGGSVVNIASVVPADNAASVPVANASAALQLQAAPNPMNLSTSISFVLAEASDVQLGIYDASGRMVKSLVNGSLESGTHSIEWDGKADSGTQVSSGVYYTQVQVQKGQLTQVRSVIVLD